MFIDCGQNRERGRFNAESEGKESADLKGQNCPKTLSGILKDITQKRAKVESTGSQRSRELENE